MGPPLGVLPSHRGERFPRSTREPALGSRRLHADHRSGSRQAPPELRPGPTTGVRFRWHPYAFDTSSAVHFRSSSQRSPDGFIPPFPESLTTLVIGPAQHPAVWTLVLQPESEGPSLISHAARLLLGGRDGLPSAPSWRTVVRVAHQRAQMGMLTRPQGVEHVQEDVREER